MGNTIDCPECGKEWPEELGLKYCGDCGSELTPDRPETITRERRTLNVLFADLSGFTTFSEEKDPEKVEEIIDDLLSRLGKVVEEYGGYVDKYLGDAVMAIFGAPEAHEDDPLRAVRAGLEMLDEVSVFNNEQKESLSLRVGIDRGEVVWSRVGGGNYTATGDAVNVAQRLEEAADPDTVLVSRSIQKHTDDRIRFRKLDALSLEGREEMVQPYLAEETRELQEPYEQTGGVTASLLGRDAELRRLLDRFENSGPSFVAVTGPAGIGKSRLLKAFEQRLVEHDELVAVGKGSASAHGDLLREPFAELLLQKADTGRGDPEAGPKAAGEIISDFAGSKHDRTRRENIAHLMALSVGLDVPEARVKGLPAEKKQEETRLAWSEWVTEQCKAHPVVMFLEDLHWAGKETYDLLGHLAEHLRSEPVDLTVVVTLRPEGDVPEGFEQITLTELSREACRGIAEEVLGGPVTADFVEFMVEETAGNPYFLEEMVRYLLEKDRLEETSDGYGLAGETTTEEQVPETLNGLLVGRIDRLPEREKETLKTASVAGRRFWLGLLEEALDREVRRDVKTLSGREMVFERAESEIPGDLEYLFKHALLRDSAYGLLTKKARRQLHGAYSEKLEEIARRQDVPNRSVLGLAAHHAKEAGQEERAGDLWIEATNEAMQEDQYEEAISYARQARETPERTEARLLLANSLYRLSRYEPAREEVTSVLEGECSDRRRLRARLLKAELYKAMGDLNRALETIEQTKNDPAFAGKDLTVEIRLRMLHLEGDIHRAQGNYETAKELFERALEQGKETGNENHVGDILNGLGLVYDELGEYDKALTKYREALRFQREIGDRNGKADSLNNIGLVHHNLGDHEKALEHFQKSLEIRREIGHRSGEAESLNNIGIVFIQLKEPKKALQMYWKSLQIDHDVGDRYREATTLHNIGNLNTILGNYEIALKKQKKSLQIIREVGNQTSEAAILGGIGHLKFFRGEYGESREILNKAETIARETGHKRFLMRSLLAQGQIDLVLNRVQKNRRSSGPPLSLNKEELLKTAEGLGAVYILVSTHALLARFAVEEGDLKKAGDHLKEAHEVLRSVENRQVTKKYLRAKAELERARGHEDKARNIGKQILELARETGERPWIARGHYLAGEEEKAREVASEIGLKSLLDKLDSKRSK